MLLIGQADEERVVRFNYGPFQADIAGFVGFLTLHPDQVFCPDVDGFRGRVVNSRVVLFYIVCYIGVVVTKTRYLSINNIYLQFYIVHRKTAPGLLGEGTFPDPIQGLRLHGEGSCQ